MNAARVTELERALEQACRDLQQAHDEVMRQQGCEHPERYDWPVWTPQANTIRWAERLLGKSLAKPRSSAAVSPAATEDNR
jgi:hypothetical protein